MTTASIDWHFAVLKNYSSIALKGSKAVFTMIVNDGQISLLLVVGSTEVQKVSQFLQTAVHRDKLDFHVLWADTRPHNKECRERIFGKGLLGWLGLFHLMHRITMTLLLQHHFSAGTFGVEDVIVQVQC
jgi:hypothetical protein